MPSQGTTLSVRTPRRSRSPALALDRVSGTPLDRKVDPTPDRARIQVLCLHKLVGIAPQKLLFHADVTKGGILLPLTEMQSSSPVVSKMAAVCGRTSVTYGTMMSASDTAGALHCRTTVTSARLESAIDRKVGR